MTSRRRLRVHLMIDSLGWGGAEMLLADFAVGARAAEIDLSVGYLKDKDGNPAADRLRALGIEPVRAPITGLLAPSSLRSVRRHLAETGAHLVHSHLGYADFLAGRAARSLGIPAVTTMHVMQWEGGLRERSKLTLFAQARRRCMARVITVSDAARGAYLSRGWDRPERVVTIHNGIVGAPLASEGAAVRAELGIHPDDLVVAMVSVLRVGKGHEVAAAAVESLRHRIPQLRLLVVGTGPDRDRVSDLMAPLGQRATLVGHRDDIMGVLDAADILLHPSSFDAFPTAVIEAMAAGVPVAACAVGGIPEIVDHGSTGLLIGTPATAAGVADVLSKLAEDPELRHRLGRAGQSRFRARFTAQRWGARTRELYDEVLSGQGQRTSAPDGTPTR